MKKKQIKKKSAPSVFGLLKPYRKQVLILAGCSIGASGLGLLIPKIISHSIDAYVHQTFVMNVLVIEFVAVTLGIFLLTYIQGIMQTVTSERVAKDLRNAIAQKISNQSYAFVEKITPAKILTNLTADVDSIKMFVGQAISTLISSLVIITGAALILLFISWKLALAVLCIMPLIAAAFFFIFRRVGVLMKKGKEVIDWLNKVINESVLGSSLIRVLNSQGSEFQKFMQANTKAKDLGLQILGMFAMLIPIITFVANLAMLVILVLGGHFVISQSMSLGDFAAFNSYIALLIFPLLMLGVMSNFIAQAQASYERIAEVLYAKEEEHKTFIKKKLQGHIEFKKVSVKYGERDALKEVSFEIHPATKTAIIGPTAAGKTQILYLLTRLISAGSGEILIDGKPIDTYDPESLHKQMGFVFQDSIVFNLTLKENITFGGDVKKKELDLAIQTAELADFIESLPEGLNTVISERGSNLSGGQKQRIMLARALTLHPKILLLDDFTARVDSKTERKIISNLLSNYPDITLVSVTQKIESVQDYDQIILLMEGEVVASGTHQTLLVSSVEYAQIYDSQKSTSHYE